MGKLHLNQAAEKEANENGKRFMNSTNVVEDMSRVHGVDLSSVRIHADGNAAQQTAARGVDAYSTGKDVFFARNAFNQSDPASRGLLAHELTHSLQQGMGSEAASIQQSAPVGAEQGGFFDFFRRGAAPSELERGLIQESVQEEEAQWAENDYGQVPEKYITNKPDRNHTLWAYMYDTDLDGPTQTPVLETHSFMPRESVDGVGAQFLHSYIGLRFTHRTHPNRFERKRIKVGFGGGGSPFSTHGTLMDDRGTQADMSTETPITKSKLEEVMDVIPQKSQEPYNVFSHNCNDFVKEIAEMVGARVPAQLHDSTLGPAGAYKNLANAAAGGEQQRTRFFQGGAVGAGQMSRGQRQKLMSGFYETAKSAARWDATPFMFNRDLAENASQMKQSATKMEPFFDRTLEKISEENELKQILREVNTNGKALMRTKATFSLSHPRVNMVTMKSMALAKQLERRFLPKFQLVENIADEDTLLSSLDSYISNAELDKRRDHMKRIARAKAKNEDVSLINPTSVSNDAYFKDLKQNMFLDKSGTYDKEQNNMEIVGDLFLRAAGLTPDAILRHIMSVGNEIEGNLRNQIRVAEIMRLVRDNLRSGNLSDINKYLERYAQKHIYLNHSQIAASIAVAITDRIMKIADRANLGVASELTSFRGWEIGVAQRRKENSLDYEDSDENDNSVGDFLRRNIVNTRNNPNNAKRFEALNMVNDIEKFFFEKLSALTRAQTQQ